MTRHGNLDKDAIRSLVDQASKVATISQTLPLLKNVVEEVVLERFQQGKRLTGIDLAANLRFVDEAICADFHPLERHTTKIDATRVHPKGEKAENLYVGLRVRDDGDRTNPIYQLFCFRFFTTRKLVTMEQFDLPLAFAYHAAERIIEKSANIDEAFRTIAKGLIEWATMLYHAADVSIDKNAGFMAHPGPNQGGLFLGDYLQGRTDKGQYSRMNGTAVTKGFGSVEHTDSPIYVARTFVDPFELRPDQIELRDTLSIWRSTFREQLTEATKPYLYPKTLHCETREMGLADDVVGPLNELVGHPSFRRIVVPLNIFKFNERHEVTQISMRLATPPC